MAITKNFNPQIGEVREIEEEKRAEAEQPEQVAQTEQFLTNGNDIQSNQTNQAQVQQLPLRVVSHISAGVGT